MKRIGLISDTHGFIDSRVFAHFEDCNEIWHAGDFGNMDVVASLEPLGTLRGVYGNIDDIEIRSKFPLEQRFELEGIKVFMIHIGGYPGHYPSMLKDKLKNEPCDLFICGHSHILKIMPDKDFNLLAINPGAAGKHGFHQIRTIMKMDLSSGKIENVKVIELGKRA